MHQSYTCLGKPLQIGKLTVKNRFCMAPLGGGQHHLPGGGLKNETIQYFVERVKGGFMGGAASHDIDDGILDPAEPGFERKYWRMRRIGAYFRVLGRSWWPEEMPSDEEYAEAEANLERVGWSVNCALTHCAPTSIAKAIGPGYQPDKLTDFLESVRERRQFRRWFCGHYYLNRVIDERFVIQWEQISKIEKDMMFR